MVKGQISLDLILTLILVIIILNSFALITSQIKTSQEETTFENHLRETNSELTSLITTIQALKDSNFIITIYNQKLNYSGSKLYPLITVDNNILTLTAENISTKNTFADNNILIDASLEKLVITNE